MAKSITEVDAELALLKAQAQKAITGFEAYTAKTDKQLQLRDIGLRRAKSQLECLQEAASIIEAYQRIQLEAVVDFANDQLVVVLDGELHGNPEDKKDRLRLLRPSKVMAAMDLEDCDAMEGWKRVWGWDGEKFVEAELRGPWHDPKQPLALEVEVAGETHHGHGTEH